MLLVSIDRCSRFILIHIFKLEKRRHAIEEKFGRDFEVDFSKSPDLVGGLSELFELNKVNIKHDEEKPTYKTAIFGDLDDDLEIDEDFNLNCGGGWCTEDSPSFSSGLPIPVLPTLHSSSGPDYSIIVQGTTCNARRNLEHPAAGIGLKH